MNLIQNMIEKNFKEHTECLNIITSKLISLESRMSNLESNLKIVNKNDTGDENINELKKEMLNFDMNDIKKAIVYKDYRTIIFLFKLYYKNKTNSIHQYPIRIKSKRIYEYYNNSKWIQDNDAHYIKNTLFTNIQTLLYKYNILDNVPDVDDIYNNQFFINKLSEEKYRRDTFKHIVDEIQNC